MKNDDESGIEFLRGLVRAFDYCHEGFNERHSVTELIAIRRAWQACEWDIFPDQWHPMQVKAAIAGHVPQWGKHERDPIFHPDFTPPLKDDDSNDD